MPRRTAVRSLVALLATAFFVLALSGTAAGGGSPTACENRTNNTYDKLLGCLTVDGVRAHQAALQAIGNETARRMLAEVDQLLETLFASSKFGG